MPCCTVFLASAYGLHHRLLSDFFYGIEGILENLAIWPWIYEVQCYNESEPKTIVVAVVMGIIFYLLMVAGLFCLSRIKQR